MIQRPRQIEDNEFLQAFMNQLQRLHIQISNLDAGHVVVRDDLAGSLRTLFCRGKGNDVLRRFCSRFGKEQPKAKVSPSITDKSGLQFGFSGILIDPSQNEGVELCVPDELGPFCCASVRVGDVLQEFTWEQVVEDYGNTFGSHLSRTIPVLFDRVQIYGLGHIDFGSFMLRNLAVVVSSCAQELIQSLGQGYSPTSINPYFNGIQITRGTYHRRGGKEYLQAKVQKENWKIAGKVMTVQTPEQDILEFSISDGGHLSVTIKKST